MIFILLLLLIIFALLSAICVLDQESYKIDAKKIIKQGNSHVYIEGKYTPNMYEIDDSISKFFFIYVRGVDVYLVRKNVLNFFRLLFDSLEQNEDL